MHSIVDALIYGVVRAPDGSGVAGAQAVSTIAGRSVTTANGDEASAQFASTTIVLTI